MEHLDAKQVLCLHFLELAEQHLKATATARMEGHAAEIDASTAKIDELEDELEASKAMVEELEARIEELTHEAQRLQMLLL